MKQLLASMFALAIGIQIGRTLEGGSRATAQQGRAGGAACSSRSGDVNADGTVDLADPVTILRYLFLGSPAELPPLCDSPGAPAAPLPTGQAGCYELDGEQGWVEVPCDEAGCRGQDAAYAAGCPRAGRFVDHGDGTVTDRCTGLQWQTETLDGDGDGRSTDQDSITWCDALSRCEDLTLAGHDDWRLPNVRELESLIDYASSTPLIDPLFGTYLSVYWASTSNTQTPERAWGVYFVNGFVINDFKTAFYYARAVRTAR